MGYSQRRLIRLIGLLISLSLLVSAASAARLSPSLEHNLASLESKSDTLISLVIFAESNHMSSKNACLESISPATLKEIHNRVIEKLQNDSRVELDNIVHQILRIDPSLQIRRFWIAPAIALDISASKLRQLLTIPGIAAIYEDAELELIKPVNEMPAVAKTTNVADHLISLNIPALWARGLTGRGRLVCSFDTGVEGIHPALFPKWRGRHTSTSAAWFAPASDDTFPVDRTGHGTHTMGLMVGSTPTDSFGVAPGAEWISAAVIDQGQTLNKTLSDILAAFEWAVDPDDNPATVHDMPDVILNSWGVPTSIMEPCDPTFDQVIDNVEAAGVVTIFAAGNEGPDPQSIRIPANRATSSLNSFSVGAIDGATNLIAGFSSRGPSSCNNAHKKPEVVAPGVAIYSSAKGGGYTLKSGTSMSAPLIAGLVALLRQYNPDATVNEIKTAIMNSAYDLGEPGEDNNYGYGLPDAELALMNMPALIFPPLEITGKIIGGDGIADPGEQFDLFLGLETLYGSVDSLTAYLECQDPQVVIINDRADFIFFEKNSQAVNYDPYVIAFDSSLTNGTYVPFALEIRFPHNMGRDTLFLDLMIGKALKGSIITHITPKAEFTVSDFGQYGFGINSIFPANGVGFKFNGSSNLLYESGIIIGRNGLQLSSSVRDSNACAGEPDFCPIHKLSTVYPDELGGLSSQSRFVDNDAEIPIPITISQTVSSFDSPGDDGYFIFKFHLVNNLNENLNGLYFGFLNDFDLDSLGDGLELESDYNMLCQSGGGYEIGIMPLVQFNGLISIENYPLKIGLSKTEKFTYLSMPEVNINDSLRSDFMSLLTFGPFNFAPFDSIEIALAVVAGMNRSELLWHAERALNKFYGPTDVDDDPAIMPGDFALYQNFPNPFNPSTVISFQVFERSSIRLDIMNILGERVALLMEEIVSPGHHSVVWQGINDEGIQVPSGVYFYRLETKSGIQTRKMLRIK